MVRNHLCSSVLSCVRFYRNLFVVIGAFAGMYLCVRVSIHFHSFLVSFRFVSFRFVSFRQITQFSSRCLFLVRAKELYRLSTTFFILRQNENGENGVIWVLGQASRPMGTILIAMVVRLLFDVYHVIAPMLCHSRVSSPSELR